MTINRLTFEDNITACEGVIDDLDTLLEEVIEGEPTRDEISNVLLGMSEIYKIRFRKLRREFEFMLKDKQIIDKEPQ